MTFPGGKCIFEHIEEYCKDDIEVILTCHRSKMTELLSKVLLPSLKEMGQGESVTDAAKRETENWSKIANSAISILTREEGEESSILSWALINVDDTDDTDEESSSNTIGSRQEVQKMKTTAMNMNEVNDTQADPNDTTSTATTSAADLPNDQLSVA